MVTPIPMISIYVKYKQIISIITSPLIQKNFKSSLLFHNSLNTPLLLSQSLREPLSLHLLRRRLLLHLMLLFRRLRQIRNLLVQVPLRRFLLLHYQHLPIQIAASSPPAACSSRNPASNRLSGTKSPGYCTAPPSRTNHSSTAATPLSSSQYSLFPTQLNKLNYLGLRS
jgi:hypothetical protein